MAKKQPALKLEVLRNDEEFLRTSSAGHLAVSLIRGNCVYVHQSKYKLYASLF